ncbi:methyl-accepting chemotaxis protein [Nitratiruptor sp. YY08-26]|uniref:hypothetical protein n=1 Tax=unclassified Nitratiruptor TaxID=2624044 RepID=UPI0019163A58|nr:MULTISPECIES: hypothetical protein [unclassified Nitratiruptor]BCD62644.1 methyl-accepting chemotaxis protein [Nitratiruptor sp. YY08-13]BCD66580.1 methyl-accepting chemotaxis protein [Nitratiruptor sp. YY08-26]
MSNLPHPIDLTQPLHNTTPSQNYTNKEDKPRFDLNEWHSNFKKALQKQDHIAITTPILPDDFINPTPMMYELIDRDIWRLPVGRKIKDKYLGFSNKYKSLTVSLFRADEVKAICIREAKDKDGNPIKWKTYGSKRYIPYRIFDEEDPTIFVGYGIGEFLLFELLELNYMVLQSDSIALNLANNPYTPDIKERYIFALLDNDDSCKATVNHLANYYKNCKVYPIDFENVLDKELPKGYDFRDFCNEKAREIRGNEYFANPIDVKEAIIETLANEIEILTGARK